MAATLNQAILSEAFAIVQQVSFQINNDPTQETIERAKSLNTKDSQLVVDILSLTLEKSHHLLKNGNRALLLLTKIASSASVIAQNRMIKPNHIVFEEQATRTYTIPGNPPVRLKVVEQGIKNNAQPISESLTTWAHLSHTNILPIYGAFLEREDGPISLVSPQITKGNIVEHVKTLSQATRISLISDTVDGLCYLHSLGVIHGALCPQNVLITHDDRAVISGLDGSQDSEPLSVRYSAPEMMEEDASPTTASDIWSLGCVAYEMLSGRVPFHQIRQEGKVGAAITSGKRPVPPDQEPIDVDKTNDTIWRPISTCWEYEAKDRPNCLQLQNIFSTIVIHLDRPVSNPTNDHVENSVLDIDYARSILTKIIGSDPTGPLPSKIPEHLQNPLSGLCDTIVKAETVAIAARKLSADDTQLLVNVLDLIVEENLSALNVFNPAIPLLRKIMMSTHIFPQRYKINRVRYDPAPLAESDFGKVYRGHDLDVCVSVVTNPGDVSDIIKYLTVWAHAVHPNIVPFYGIFHEAADEPPQLCLVTPYMKNGLMRDYAPHLPQRDRVPLLSDVINGLIHLDGLNIVHYNVRAEDFLISDEGHALLAGLGSGDILTSPGNTKATNSPRLYVISFYSPERVTKGKTDIEGTVWSFGCLAYEVLSRKLPYHQYTEESDIRSALSRGETPRRPGATDGGIDEITDQFWELITGCCVLDPADRLTLVEIQKKLTDMGIQDNRPNTTSLSGAEALALRTSPEINWGSVKRLLDHIQVEIMRIPLSKLIQNHTKVVAAAAMKFDSEDVRILVDFLDLALENYITLSDGRNRVLALLSRVTTFTQIFPRRYELKGVTYQPLPIAEGGYGTVHQGVSDPKICVKVMTKVDSNALMRFIKELVLWAHVSHPNVLPLYGIFVNESQKICLVSPFMTKGNLHAYAPRLPQKNRIPLLYDVIKGLVYLHGLGVVHTDLKGENVLISDEGRGLITDFGASHVITATAKGGVTTASVASTLRFSAPEIVLNRKLRPTQECDIWSFGCLCYEVLSRQLPYFEYRLEPQIYSALARKQLPKRPSASINSTDDEDVAGGWDSEFNEPDCDEIDDPSWNLITRCCTPNPEERPNALRIQELIVDLKMWDTGSEAKHTPSIHPLSLRSNPELNLNRAKELLDTLQVFILAQKTLWHRPKDVVLALKKLALQIDDRRALSGFWDLALKDQLFTSGEHSRALSLLSAFIAFNGNLPHRYLLSPIRHSRTSFGSGSFGTIHHGADSNLCIKATTFARLDPNLDAQWLKACAPLVHSFHSNVLPCYGLFFKQASISNMGYLVFPFMRKGNLCNYSAHLPQNLRILLLLDVIEALCYLHSLGIVHGNLKGENVLISDEGRALVADFRPYHINVATAEDGPTGSYITSTLRFTAPELVQNSQMLPTIKSDMWSFGCLIYLVLSRKVPFYQYSKGAEIRSALSQGELLERPTLTDDGVDKIDDQTWDIIKKCCSPEPDDRPILLDVQDWLAKLGVQDDRLPAKTPRGAEIIKLRRTNFGVDVPRAGDVMAQIISQLPPSAHEGEIEEEIRN